MDYNSEYNWMVCVQCMTFNHSSYIINTLDGFTMQETTFPFVSVIIDDASIDGTPEILQRYLSDNFDEPYRVEETEYAFIICAKHQTNHNCFFVVLLLKYNHYNINKEKLVYISEWVNGAKYQALCEGDDYWTAKDKLQQQVEAMESNPHYCLCHTGFDFYYEEKRKIKSGEKFTNNNNKMINSNEDIIFGVLDGNRYRIQTMTVLFPTKTYNNVTQNRPKEWNSFLMGDTPLWILLLEKGDVCFIPNNMAVYRIHGNSACRPSSLSQRLRFVLSSDEMRLTLGEYIHLDNNKMKILQGRYNKSLSEYLYYNPSFKPTIQPVFKSSIEAAIFKVKTSRFATPLFRYLFELNRAITKIIINIVHK